MAIILIFLWKKRMPLECIRSPPGYILLSPFGSVSKILFVSCEQLRIFKGRVAWILGHDYNIISKNVFRIQSQVLKT